MDLVPWPGLVNSLSTRFMQLFALTVAALSAGVSTWPSYVQRNLHRNHWTLVGLAGLFVPSVCNNLAMTVGRYRYVCCEKR
jgi:hypothetical protein